VTGTAWVDAVRSATGDDDGLRQLVDELAVEPPLADPALLARYAGEVCARLAMFAVERRIAQTHRRLQQLDVGSADALPLQQELLRLETEKRMLRERAMGDS
jgi:DNA primase